MKCIRKMTFGTYNYSGGPGGASDPKLEYKACAYETPAPGLKARAVWGIGCVLGGLEGEGHFYRTLMEGVKGWGRRWRSSWLWGQGRQRHGGSEGLGMSWDVQVGRTLDVSGQRLSRGWGSASLSEASCWVSGQDTLQPPS